MQAHLPTSRIPVRAQALAGPRDPVRAQLQAALLAQYSTEDAAVRLSDVVAFVSDVLAANAHADAMAGPVAGAALAAAAQLAPCTAARLLEQVYGRGSGSAGAAARLQGQQHAAAGGAPVAGGQLQDTGLDLQAAKAAALAEADRLVPEAVRGALAEAVRDAGRRLPARAAQALAGLLPAGLPHAAMGAAAAVASRSALAACMQRLVAQVGGAADGRAGLLAEEGGHPGYFWPARPLCPGLAQLPSLTRPGEPPPPLLTPAHMRARACCAPQVPGAMRMHVLQQVEVAAKAALREAMARAAEAPDEAGAAEAGAAEAHWRQPAGGEELGRPEAGPAGGTPGQGRQAEAPTPASGQGLSAHAAAAGQAAEAGPGPGGPRDSGGSGGGSNLGSPGGPGPGPGPGQLEAGAEACVAAEVAERLARAVAEAAEEMLAAAAEAEASTPPSPASPSSGARGPGTPWAARDRGPGQLNPEQRVGALLPQLEALAAPVLGAPPAEASGRGSSGAPAAAGAAAGEAELAAASERAARRLGLLVGEALLRLGVLRGHASAEALEEVACGLLEQQLEREQGEAEAGADAEAGPAHRDAEGEGEEGGEGAVPRRPGQARAQDAGPAACGLGLGSVLAWGFARLFELHSEAAGEGVAWQLQQLELLRGGDGCEDDDSEDDDGSSSSSGGGGGRGRGEGRRSRGCSEGGSGGGGGGSGWRGGRRVGGGPALALPPVLLRLPSALVAAARDRGEHGLMRCVRMSLQRITFLSMGLASMGDEGGGEGGREGAGAGGSGGQGRSPMGRRSGPGSPAG
jgi:hypothetical protein